MAAKNQLFQVDDIIVDGVAIAFESGTAELEGIAGYEHEVVPSATGDDFTKYKRVGRTLKAKIQFGPTTTPEMFANISEAQISLRQRATSRRAIALKCSFGKMGTVGTGSVEVTFNMLSPLQWL